MIRDSDDTDAGESEPTGTWSTGRRSSAMATITTAGTADGNRVLLALSETTAFRRSRVEQVALRHGEVLAESGGSCGHVYFVHEGLVSLMTMLEDGRAIQTGIVGREGMIGHPYLADFDVSHAYATVTVSGRASRVAADDLYGALTENPQAREIIGRFARAFLTQTLQAVACNAVHSAEQRLAKWLLQCEDRVGDGIPLSQEFIAQMLGVSRPTVSLIMGRMQDAEIIHQRRRQIAVADREALEDLSCPCYRTIRSAYEKLLPLN